MKNLARFTMLLLVVLSSVQISSAQHLGGEQDSLKKEMEILREGQSAIQKELQDIKRMLQATQPTERGEPSNLKFSIDGAPVMGNGRAKLVMIEFSDYQCPFCGSFALNILPKIEDEYISTGKLRLAFRNLPLENIHPQAFGAAEAAGCAGEQGKFWEMHKLLFKESAQLTRAQLATIAEEARVDLPQFQKCLDSGKVSAAIRSDIAVASQLGVTGTPTFFLGVANSGDADIRVLKAIVGGQPYENFKAVLDDLLRDEGR